MLKRFGQITICLENTYEPQPDLILKIIQEIHDPRFLLCLDVAHAHVCSTIAPEAWIPKTAQWLGHMHWNDNLGDKDAHLALGDGMIRWPRVWKEVLALHRPTTCTLELSSLKHMRQSLRCMETLGFWPPPSA
jgi:sugar phosphate isomerase/epimerase